MSSSIGTSASVGEVLRRFGLDCDRTEIGPVLIERSGLPGVVMMAALEYKRLVRLDHAALLPGELDAADLVALRDAAPDGGSQSRV